MPSPLTILKRGLVVFWAIWFTLALASNLCEGCRQLRIARWSWRFASGNYDLLEEVHAKVGSPPWLGRVLFGGVLAWEALIVGAYWRAVQQSRGTAGAFLPAADTAFATSAGLWGAFLVADECFVAHETGVEAAHLRVLTAQLASLLCVHLLPD